MYVLVTRSDVSKPTGKHIVLSFSHDICVYHDIDALYPHWYKLFRQQDVTFEYVWNQRLLSGRVCGECGWWRRNVRRAGEVEEDGHVGR